MVVSQASTPLGKTTAFTPFVTQVCKGIATLMLLSHHLWFNSNPALYSESLHVFALHKCKVCVAMFLMLSGAGISLSGCMWKKNFLYRIPKILLSYWFVGLIFVLIGMVFFGRTFETAYPNGTGWIFWLQLFGVNWIASCGGFNPTWWFMDAIMPLYYVAPICYLLLKWNSFVFVMLAFVASIFSWDFYWWSTPFAFGMAAVAMGAFECLSVKKNAIIGMILHSTFLGVTYCWVTDIFQHFLIAFFLISFICSLCVIGGRLVELIFSPMAFIGRHSMNIFLLYTFFLIWFHGFFTSNKPAVTFTILLGASLLCSIMIEKMKELIGFYRLAAFLKEAAS